MSLVSVYVVFATTKEAESIGRTVVEDGLAACINILPGVRSIYRWNGSISTVDEVAAILKTSERSLDALMTRLADLHSYEVPCIVTWPVGKALQGYAEWVAGTTC